MDSADGSKALGGVTRCVGAPAMSKANEDRSDAAFDLNIANFDILKNASIAAEEFDGASGGI
jgi:hypothetical protein